MYSSVTGVLLAVCEGRCSPGKPEQAPTPKPKQSAPREAAAHLRMGAAHRWFIMVLHSSDSSGVGDGGGGALLVGRG